MSFAQPLTILQQGMRNGACGGSVDAVMLVKGGRRAERSESHRTLRGPARPNCILNATYMLAGWPLSHALRRFVLG